MNPDTIVKIGGSLYDLPDLASRLNPWLASLDSARLLLVPGGGETAEVVRTFHSRQGLNEELCHWLALRALALNAHFLAGLICGASVIDNLGACASVWRAGRLPILDLYAFACTDEAEPGRLTHSWDVTSDSLAARVAAVAGARRLVLLKSVTIPPGKSWEEAAQCGHVDAAFPAVVQRARGLEVQAINWRAAAR
jgi:aspartokinase-like uncharacterized kinase